MRLVVAPSASAESTRARGALPRLRPTPYPSQSTLLRLSSTSHRLTTLHDQPLEPRPPPQLPLEILHLIVESIPYAPAFNSRDRSIPWRERRESEGRKIRAALLSCCLAGKALLPAALGTLYRELDLTILHTGIRLAPFDTGDLTDKDAILAVARTEHHLPLVRHFDLSADYEFGPSASADYSVLRGYLRCLRRVKSAYIGFPDSNEDIDALVDGLATCAPLRELEVYAPVGQLMGSPLVTLVSYHTTLKSLDLSIRSYLQFPPMPWSTPAIGTGPAAFGLVTLRLDADIITRSDLDFLTGNSTFTLVTLELVSRLSMDDTLSLAHFTSLRELTLGARGGITFSTTLFTLSSLHQLQSFTFTVSSDLTSSDLLVLLCALPPSVKTISSPRLTIPDTTTLLAHSFPHLEYIFFSTRLQASVTNHARAGGKWTPHEQLAIVRAALALGYRMVAPEPRDPDLVYSRYRRNHHLPYWRQRTLDELGWSVAQS